MDTTPRVESHRFVSEGDSTTDSLHPCAMHGFMWSSVHLDS